MSVSLWFHQHASAQPDVRSNVPVPMVYETLQPPVWEYTVLPSDPTKLDVEGLNALGTDGWLLVSVLKQENEEGIEIVYYYFVRQKI